MVTLAADSQVLLNQLDGPAVAVNLAETPTATTVRQWAQWTQVDGLTWEDGTPVTPADALFAFEVARSPETPNRPDFVTATAEYEALDDRTIRWTGVPGFATPTYYLNHAGFLPEHVYGRLSAGLRNRPTADRGVPAGVNKPVNRSGFAHPRSSRLNGTS